MLAVIQSNKTSNNAEKNVFLLSSELVIKVCFLTNIFNILNKDNCTFQSKWVMCNSLIKFSVVHFYENKLYFVLDTQNWSFIVDIFKLKGISTSS